jgi:anti-sigma regulatory factor (Ser/Thr protein kinase)
VFERTSLQEVRAIVTERAAAAGLAPDRADELLLAANEIATNSIRHGGGAGELRVWEDGDTLVCEVRDRGEIGDPLVGRRRPSGNDTGGYGLWLANQLCELVQVRSTRDGSVIRLHVRR